MAEAAKAGVAMERAGGAGSALERATALAGGAKDRWASMPPRQRRWLGVSLVTVCAVCAGMMWFAGRTEWRTLFTGLDGKDVQQIAQELSAAGIGYELTEDGGGVRVPSDQLDKARMEVAAKGMPQRGRMGFELFDKPNWVGSEFDEKVNYQRALEGELEHTIETLAVVRSARVHVVLGKESAFTDGDRAAKASVVLNLKSRTMPPEEVESIRNLVAGAVENLNPSQVTLVDADGRVDLTAHTKDDAGGDGIAAERALQEKLVAMLEPTVGRDNVRATVTVSYDRSSQDRTDEVVDPAQVAAVTMQRSQQSTVPAARAQGVPGTASNTPEPAAAGSLQAGAQAAAGGSALSAAQVPVAGGTSAATAKTLAGAAVPPLLQSGLPVYPQSGGSGVQTTTEENGSYAVTRHVTHSEEGPGRVRRVTAAVVVNDRMATEGAGKTEKTVWKPRSADEMKRLEQLAQAAVGFDGARGDQVVVENVGFSTNVAEKAPPMLERVMEETGTLLRGQTGLLRTLSVAGVGLLLVVMVLRPMAKGVVEAVNRPSEPMLLASGAGMRTGAVRTDAAGLPEALPTGSPLRANLRTGESQALYEQVSATIRREPAQGTRLLESWIGETVKERN